MQHEQTLSAHTLTKAIYADGQVIVFQLTSTGTIEAPQLAYTLYSQQPIDASTQSAAIDRITFFLSLADLLKTLTNVYKSSRLAPKTFGVN